MKEIPAGRIDVHHHVIPPAFVAAMSRRGFTRVAGAPLPKWTPERSIAVMDQNGIETAITSLSAPGVYFGDLGEASDLARRCNEFAAEMCARHPGRFGSFAVLPMPFTESACAEATYALDHLNADGVVLLGSTEGKFLGDPSLDELMAELDRRRATVFVHPNLHATSEAIGLEMPGFLIEFLCDTTRAALKLILSGTLERYPSIRWILAHAGGFLPYVAWRVSLANLMPPYDERAPQGVLTYVKRFYYDTALSPSRYSMAVLEELVEPSHILFGSDFPFAPEALTAVQTKTLDESLAASGGRQHGIGRGHALSLFPKYRKPGEAVVEATAFLPLSTRGRVERVFVRPLVALAEHLRNR